MRTPKSALTIKLRWCPRCQCHVSTQRYDHKIGWHDSLDNYVWETVTEHSCFRCGLTLMTERGFDNQPKQPA